MDIQKTQSAFAQNGIVTHLVKNKSEALDKLVSLIPKDSKILTGSSLTLNQIGFSDLLISNQHQWQNLQLEIDSQPDKTLRADLRRNLLTKTDYYLAGANALTEDGQIIAVDATGTRVGAYPFAAKNLILVVGTNKIVTNLEDAFKRIRGYVFPLEDARSKKEYGSGTAFGKWVIIEKEFTPNRIQLILVEQDLGF